MYTRRTCARPATSAASERSAAARPRSGGHVHEPATTSDGSPSAAHAAWSDVGAPSAARYSGTSGGGFVFDYYWGMELYPRICGVDVKKFVNCRFSMTFWQLAGLSFCAASRELHGRVDPGLLLCALSQFLYLAKFYVWEIGYMRSIGFIP